MQKLKLLSKHKQQGFTIVELMIATVVLSIVLLFVSAVMVGIGNLFEKGVNQSRTQDAARSITDDIAQNLKFDGGTLGVDDSTNPLNPLKPHAFCIGNTRYSFVTGQELGSGKESDNTTDKTAHVLWRDTKPSSGCSPVTLSDPNLSSGTELIPPNSRLTAFCIGDYASDTGNCTPATSSPYTITIEVAYGDNDLLSDITGSDVTCKGSVGDQFCATASLITTVVQRVQ